MKTIIPARLAPLPKKEPLAALIKAYRAAFPKGELFLVGGTVRDALLGKGDSKDYDLVSRGVMAEQLEKFLKKLGRVDLVGKRFGVWKFLPKGFEESHALDIALPRTEHSFNEGGYRDVSVSSDPNLKIEDDLARRDFTVNAMALKLTPKLELIDPYEGRTDLRDKTLRTVGNAAERFREDYSRMLRAIRFSCQLGFKIDDETMLGIRLYMQHVNDVRPTPGGNMRIVATEIIAREIIKALVSDPTKAFDLLYDTTATDVLMPELLAMRGCGQPLAYHSEGDVWTHTRIALTRIGDEGFVRYFGKEKPSALVYLATLFHDIGKPPTKQTPEEHGTDRVRFNGHDLVGSEMTESIARRLTFSAPTEVGVDTDKLVWIVRFHLFTLSGKIEEIRPTTLEKYFFNPNLPGRELLQVIYCDSMATVPEGGMKKEHLQHLDALMKRVAELEKLGAGKKLPPPILNGGEIMKLTKLKPGPEVGKLIAALREAQLSGKVKTAAQATAFIRKIRL
jgi:putative nucleotidyltransferase with HDIG domain